MADLTPTQIQAIIAKLRTTDGPHTRPFTPVDPTLGAEASLDAYRAKYGDNHKNPTIHLQ